MGGPAVPETTIVLKGLRGPGTGVTNHGGPWKTAGVFPSTFPATPLLRAQGKQPGAKHFRPRQGAAFPGPKVEATIGEELPRDPVGRRCLTAGAVITSSTTCIHAQLRSRIAASIAAIGIHVPSIPELEEALVLGQSSACSVSSESGSTQSPACLSGATKEEREEKGSRWHEAHSKANGGPRIHVFLRCSAEAAGPY